MSRKKPLLENHSNGILNKRFVRRDFKTTSFAMQSCDSLRVKYCIKHGQATQHVAWAAETALHITPHSTRSSSYSKQPRFGVIFFPASIGQLDTSRFSWNYKKPGGGRKGRGSQTTPEQKNRQQAGNHFFSTQLLWNSWCLAARSFKGVGGGERGEGEETRARRPPIGSPPLHCSLQQLCRVCAAPIQQSISLELN